jgi:hypothetical protein
MVRNPLKIPRNIRMKRRPYTKQLSWAYDYKVVDDDQRKTTLILRQRPKSQKVIKNPFQKTGFLGLRKK